MVTLYLSVVALLRYFFSVRPGSHMGVEGGGKKYLLISLLTVFLFSQDYYGNIST